MLEISLRGVSEKLKDRFPVDPKSDFIVQYRGFQYQLSPDHLRLYSGYFENNIKDSKKISFDEIFQQEFLYHVLSCFYGWSVKIERKDALSYFEIIKFLDITSLYPIFLNDIKKNLKEYDFFEVLETAHLYNLEQIFERCLYQLQQKQFKQIKEYTDSLLNTSVTIFKLVIKSYNKQEKKAQILTPYQVQQLILNYCQANNLDFRHSSNLKIQLIDKNSLTSKEYHDIFLMDQSIVRHYQEFTNKKKSRNPLNNQNISVSVGFGGLNNSLNVENKVSYRSLVLNMQTTFEKKINIQLSKEQQKLLKLIHDEQKQFLRQSSRDVELSATIQDLNKRMKHDFETRIIEDKIHRMERKLNSLQNTMNENDRQLKQIVKRTEQEFEKYDIKEKSMMEMSEIVNSKSSLYFGKKDFAAAPIISPKNNKMQSYHENSQNDKPIFKKEEKKIAQGKVEAIKVVNDKPLKSPRNTEKKIQRSFLDRNFWEIQKHLQFNLRPLSIQNEKQLTALADMIAPDRFQFKRLDLLLKRSTTSTNFGSEIDLRGLKNLLVIFRTDQNKVVGGKISTEIPLLAEDYVEDSTAFIFSLTENKKFKIKKQCKDEAIMLNEGYIICFSTDLMISQKFMSENYCSWPSAYQANKDGKHNTAKWLVGDPIFRIVELQCYHIERSQYKDYQF